MVTRIDIYFFVPDDARWSVLSTAAEVIAEKIANERLLKNSNWISSARFSWSTKWATPLNYHETNIAYEIPSFSDADRYGNVEECFEDIKPVHVWGDNHCGYIGFRNPFGGSLIDDGAMNI